MTAEVVTDARRLLVTKVRVEHNWNQYYNTTGIDCEQRYLALTGKMFNNASFNVRTVTNALPCVALFAVVGRSWICQCTSRRSHRDVGTNVEEGAEETNR